MSLCGSGAWACVCLQQNLQVAFQPQDLQGRYAECGGMLTEAHKEVRTLGRRAPVSTGPVTCYTYTVPLVRTLPSAFCPLCALPCWLISIPHPFLALEVGAGVLWGSPALPCRRPFLVSRRPWTRSSEYL